MRIYRWLLRLCPQPLRRDYGAAMEEMFLRRLADARAAGRWPLALAWRREVAGLISLAASERYRLGPIGRRKAGQMDVSVKIFGRRRGGCFGPPHSPRPHS